MTTIETSIGDAVVSHRLALAVECIDATTERIVAAPLRIIGEHSGTVLSATGPGRAAMVRSRRTPARATVRISDSTRQFVPRRVTIPLWTLTEISDDDNFVPAESRMLRTWLLPGSAYPLVRGTTALRGRVETNSVAVRWPRILAKDSADGLIGWAHGDERGEFILVLRIPYVLPTRPDIFSIRLDVSAPGERRPHTADALDDLVIEQVPRPLAPPQPTTAEKRLLRGQAIPPTYRTAQPVTVTARLGALIVLDNPVPFPL